MTPLQRAADTLLRDRGLGSLHDYVQSHLDAGQSWRSVVRRLEADTDGAVAVTEVTLRSWMAARRDGGEAA